jgi:hypothetical protein
MGTSDLISSIYYQLQLEVITQGNVNEIYNDCHTYIH